MNGLTIRLIFVAIAVPIAMVSGYKANKERIATYHITEVDKPIMQKCSRLMSGEDVEFAKGASNANGCACIAKHATAHIAPEQLETFNSSLEVSLNIAHKSNNIDDDDPIKKMELMIEAENKLTAVQTKAGLTEPQFETMLTQLHEFVGVCGDSKSHKGDSLTQIAALAPLSQPIPTTTPGKSEVVQVEPKKTDQEVVAMLRK